MASASGHPDGSDGAGAAEEAAACAWPPKRKQAATTITKAKVFSAAVTNCVPLPHLMPRHCRTKNPTITRIAMSLTWPARGRMRSPLYSPMTMPAAARNSGAEFRHGRSTGKRVEAADDPDAEEKINVGEPLRNVAGRANDTSGDGIADRGGNSEPHAENLEKAAASTRGGTEGVESAARRGAARSGR